MSETNVEFVTRIMEFGVNPLMQAFIIEALDNYSKKVLQIEEEEWGAKNLISLDAWKGCAEYSIKEINNRSM